MQVYTFDDALDLPDGVTRCDASEILPESSVFFYKRGQWIGSVSGFSNVFRYKMLSEFGGYWVDADVVCLRPFPKFDRVTVSREDENRVNGAVIYAPPGDPMMADAYTAASRLGGKVVWGQTGPVLLTKFVSSGRYDVDVLNPATFYPLHWKEIVPKLLLPVNARAAAESCGDSFGIHLYNEIFQRFRISTDKLPPRDSFLGELMSSTAEMQASRISEAEIWRKRLTYYVRRVPHKLREISKRVVPLVPE